MTKWTPNHYGKLRPCRKNITERDVTWDDVIGAVSLVVLVLTIVVGVSVL